MRLSGSPINYRLGSLYSVVTAILYATQEPFSFPAAKHLNTLQFVFLTQFALLVSIPMLTAPPPSRRYFVALLRKTANYGYLAVIFAIGMSDSWWSWPTNGNTGADLTSRCHRANGSSG